MISYQWSVLYFWYFALSDALGYYITNVSVENTASSIFHLCLSLSSFAKAEQQWWFDWISAMPWDSPPDWSQSESRAAEVHRGEKSPHKHCHFTNSAGSQEAAVLLHVHRRGSGTKWTVHFNVYFDIVQVCGFVLSVCASCQTLRLREKLGVK